MFRLNYIKLYFITAIFCVFTLGIECHSAQINDEKGVQSNSHVDSTLDAPRDLSMDTSLDDVIHVEEDKLKFSMPSPFSGRELESFTFSGEYISNLASEVLYIQKVAVAIGAGSNETRFIKRQVSQIFKTTNSTLFQSIAIARLFPELYLDVLNYSDNLLYEELIKLQASIVKPEVLKASIDILIKRMLLIVDFMKQAKKSVTAQTQFIERYVSKLEKMPTNVFSSRVRKKCLALIQRIQRRHSQTFILASQLLEQINTSYINLVFLDKQLFNDTSAGALQAVVASNLSKCRRNLKFAIHQAKRHIVETPNCYEAFNKDITDFKDELFLIATALGVNRFNVRKSIARNDKLLFLSLPINSEVCRMLSLLDNIFYSEASIPDEKGRVEFESYVSALICVPLDFDNLKEKQTIFSESIVSDFNQIQETDKSEDFDSKLDK